MPLGQVCDQGGCTNLRPRLPIQMGLRRRRWCQVGVSARETRARPEDPADVGGDTVPRPRPRGAGVRHERAARTPGHPLASSRRRPRGASGARGAGGTRAEGRGAGPRPPLPSSQSFSQLHIYSALPVGVSASPSRLGRPPAPGGRRRADASGAGAAAGPSEPKGAGRGAPRGPGEPGPPHPDAARGRCRRRGGDGTAGRGRPRGRAGPPAASSRARTRGAGGSAREAHASPVRARAARYLPREQVRSESSAGSARRRRPRPAGGSIPAAGTVRPAGARGRETRGERSCAATAAAPAAAADPSPPAPLLPPRAPPRRLRSRPLAAGLGSVPVPVPAPAWPAAVPAVSPRGVGRGGCTSAATLASAPSGR
ncbi:collagen alpha-1(I) chain-like [Acinonyx jubatus]|uniref:Collagen alpha-1(I) chain-like n=1 Tax=Acinonyx jubatus TaxID=32536 RepID=A0ABM3NQ35_ACIJB|nr:collagen alpha-1(I) chain-like [Acinonyx jubatus]